MARLIICSAGLIGPTSTPALEIYRVDGNIMPVEQEGDRMSFLHASSHAELGDGQSRSCGYHNLNEHDHSVAALDPLNADAFLVDTLPKINDSTDVAPLVQAIDRLLPTLEVCARYDRHTAMAAMRDLGFMAASLATHTGGIAAVPMLEQVLLRLATITGEVPRDTVYSYGPRNRLGTCMRTFRGIPEERLFIGCVTEAIRAFPGSIDILQQALDCDLLNDQYAELLQLATQELQHMVTSMLEVRRVVSPEIFSFQLRPFFPPLQIEGRTYFAPGGAQMPLIIVDILVFGAEQICSATHAAYAAYVAENLIYLPPELQIVAHQARSRPSLVGRLCDEIPEILSAQPAVKAHLAQIVDAVLKMLAMILRFRRPHKQVAEANMRIRPPASLGSGGYTTQVLDILLACTVAAHTRMKQLQQNILGGAFEKGF